MFFNFYTAITLIFEGSHATVDFAITGMNFILKYIKIEISIILNCNKCSQYYSFYCDHTA